MKNLLKCEMKKFLKPLTHRLLILFLIILPPLMLCSMNWYDNRSKVTFDGEIISLAKEKELVDKIRSSLQGTVDESWLNNVEALLKEYETSGLNQNDMKYQTISKDYWQGLANYTIWQANLNSPTTPVIIQNDLDKYTLTYGPYEGWLTYMSIFRTCAIAFVLGCLYLFSDLFNQEDAIGIMDTLKSSQYGRKHLAFVKISIALTTTLVLGLLIYMVLTIGAMLFLNLQGGNTTAMVYEGAFQIYNFKDISFQAFILTLVGGLICSMTASFLSVISKKPFISLGTSMLFYILPSFITINFMNTSWNRLFPTNFLNFQSVNQLMYLSWVQINNQIYHRLPSIGFIWLIIISLLIMGSLLIHCKNKKYILKG